MHGLGAVEGQTPALQRFGGSATSPNSWGFGALPEPCPELGAGIRVRGAVTGDVHGCRALFGFHLLEGNDFVRLTLQLSLQKAFTI